MTTHRTGTREEWLRERLVYHFMFDPAWDEGCPSCSSIADGFNQTHLHLQNDVGFDAIWTMWQWLDRAPLGRNECDLSWFHRHDQYEASYR